MVRLYSIHLLESNSQRYAATTPNIIDIARAATTITKAADVAAVSIHRK